MTTSTPFRDLLHAVKLRHGTDGFTSPPKEGVLRIFSPWKKFWRLRLGLNPRTWVLNTVGGKIMYDEIPTYNYNINIIIIRNFIIHYFNSYCKRNEIQLSATLLYLKNVLYWPEDDSLRSKHVAVMWPDCTYFITVMIYCCVLTVYGTAVAQWLRCCATDRKVAGSIPAGVIGIFHWFQSLYGPGVD